VHAWLHAPQLLLSVVSFTQVPLHSVSPALQFVTHAPLPLHVAFIALGSVVVHTWPHPPQLLLSVNSLTQVPLHSA
jgi:hypothetical protein